MKILMATPSYGGILTTRWFNSFLATSQYINSKGHIFSVMTMERDNFIARARNTCAMVAMEQEFDKLLFIDHDQVWTPEQVEMLLESDKPIIGGTYPYKHFPLELIFNAMPEHVDYWAKDKSMAAYIKYINKFQNDKGEVEVYHLPTGFMMIDVSVFHTLKATSPQYQGIDPHTFNVKPVYDFFPIKLTPLEDSPLMAYETEDWGFCSHARSAGFKIHLKAKCIVEHYGQHTYNALKARV
jgi:hypothetical protein